MSVHDCPVCGKRPNLYSGKVKFFSCDCPYEEEYAILFHDEPSKFKLLRPSKDIMAAEQNWNSMFLYFSEVLQ